MLKTAVQTNRGEESGQFAIIASEYNRRYVDAMLRSAQTALSKAGVKNVRIVRVPGAFEIPVVASKLADCLKPRFSALICLGVIIRGETTHAQHICEAVTWCLAKIQIERRIPVIHEVLLLENEGQAKVRCLGVKYNRGAEAASTAIRMAQTMRLL
ncbi:MAG: 6,7-dimethyl-8-ribityllumazine synthase [Verrucomicrobia bacterium]|nr:6,7-dimethyl-8-ribityllumazine synthase [Verrucomicrobiota bacterium]